MQYIVWITCAFLGVMFVWSARNTVAGKERAFRIMRISGGIMFLIGVGMLIATAIRREP
jgi:hypothetical protein